MSTSTREHSFDTVIVGAGPAGCAAAAVLAEKGRRVALLERESFPRYRVGESLIPYCWFPLDRLGLTDKVRGSGFTVKKHSVQFASLNGRISQPYYFFQHSEHESSYTWQVVRSEFDQMLLDNAVAKGATLFENTTAKDLLRDGERVIGVSAVVNGDEQPVQMLAPVTIDASGRDIFAQSKNRWRVGDDKLKKVAIWTYYEGALRDPGLDEGATTIAYLPDKGWFWYIPLTNDRVSCGVVADPDYLYRDTREPREIFEREVDVQPWVKRHLECGRPTGEFHVTRDFTYRSRHCATDGLVLVGDAFSFLDPVFSSGVFFALHSGVEAGDATDAALTAGDYSAARFEAYGENLRTGMEPMRRLVHAFYDQNFNFGEFLRAHPDKGGDLTDCLIGNLYKDFEPLFTDMANFADIPEPLEHGKPKYVETSRERAG